MSKLCQKAATAAITHRLKPDDYNEVKAWLSAYPTPTDFIQFFAAKLKLLQKENEKTLQLMEWYVQGECIIWCVVN